MPAYYEFRCSICGHQERRYRNARKCSQCGKHTLERHDLAALAVVERSGTTAGGNSFWLRIGIAGIVIDGQPVDSENMAELIASNIEQAMKGKKK